MTIHEKTHQQNSQCVCSISGCTFTTSDVEAFKKHLETVHRIVKRNETMPNPRIMCTVPGCGHTFISVAFVVFVSELEAFLGEPSRRVPSPSAVHMRSVWEGVRAAVFAQSSSGCPSRRCCFCRSFLGRRERAESAEGSPRLGWEEEKE